LGQNVLLGQKVVDTMGQAVYQWDMSWEQRRVAVCDGCGHVWLPDGYPRRCAKCKSTKWNIGGEDGGSGNGRDGLRMRGGSKSAERETVEEVGKPRATRRSERSTGSIVRGAHEEAGSPTDAGAVVGGRKKDRGVQRGGEKVCPVHGEVMKDFGTKWVCEGPPEHVYVK